MLNISDALDLKTLSESCEVEFKLAQGKDNKGKLPDDFWPTYSAMANTRGGYIVLGVKEKNGKFSVAGIENIDLVQKQLFDLVDNRDKVNVNLLNNHNVAQQLIEDKSVLVVHIPAAKREQNVSKNLYSSRTNR